MMKFFPFCTGFLLLLGACHLQENDQRKIIREWQNKEIIFPSHLQARVMGQDTICEDLFHKEYKIFVYVDSSGCTPCRLHLYQWHQIIKEYQKETDKLAFIFIVHTLNPKKLDIICQENKFNYPVFYDKKGETFELNQFSQNIVFQTFFLGPDNKVLIIGDPIGRPSVMDLYKKKIDVYITEREGEKKI